ncbi:MAG TPA: carboxypeptidase regulatory-like domain-containing protein [Gemmatimonadaceae bacterium]|nr:carboxypeptidase regulatory-like domain-containing protein [Gemmatimonadaceae bacterium]
MKPLGVLLPLLLAVVPVAGHAQVGSTTDILTGLIVGPDSQPLPDASVEAVSVETGISRSHTTNAKGRWTIVFPDGGGSYRVTIKRLGMAPITITMNRQGDEDQLVANVELSPTAARLQEVVVSANRRGDPRRGREAGSTESILSPDQLSRMPIDASDLATLATLAPGVIGFDATDSTASAFSVLGQGVDQNSITLDGLTFGSGSVPQEAVRAIRVITNSYDVSRGQFSGGQVASTTRGGTNFVQGSFNYSLRNPALEVTNPDENGFSGGYLQNQLSGGLGGPIIRNKLFAFGSVQLRRRVDQLRSLTAAGGNTQSQLGVSPDSIARFLSALDAYGLPASSPEVDPDRIGDNLSALVRLDYLLTDMQTLTVRGDYRWQGQDPSRVGTFSLAQTGGNTKSWSGGIMATLTSHFESGLVNELRAYLSRSDRSSSPFLAIPQGRVLTASELADGTTGTATLSFGGNSGMPQTSSDHGLEITDELSWLAGDGHRFRLGGLYDGSRLAQDQTSNRYGTFYFNSLADLDSLKPASFTRTLAPRLRAGTSRNGAIYLGDTWRRSAALQLTYGLRLEGSRFGGAPAYNPAVDSLFGYRTDRVPTEIHLSPRIGFTWTIGASDQLQGAPTPAGGGGRGSRGFGRFGGFAQGANVIRGGIGDFRGNISTGLYSAAQGATGLTDTQARLDCVGDAVPVPDFPSYEESIDNIPTACVPSSGPIPPSFTPLASVTVFDHDFGAPRTRRASLGYQRRLLGRYTVSIDGTYARGVNQTGRTDLNLDDSPRFTLASEGNRPVFVQSSAIVPSTGAISIVGSRLHSEYGQVMRIDSRLQSETEQLSLSVNGFTTRGIIFRASYTLSHSRDQASFEETAGNPNVPAWGSSDLQRKHSIVATVSYPLIPSLELTLIGRIMAGAPYTPTVGGDINGDGSRNDRAFIYDPATAPDTAMANGMSRVLAAAPAGARECLSRQLGAIASRNSCTGPWQETLDMQANVRPSFLHLDRRLTLSVSTVNMLGGLDQLFHGSDELHGWGQTLRPDPTLMSVVGFDGAENRFLYRINDRFGNTRGSANAFRAPFQLAIQARYAIGPDAARSRLQAAFGRGGRGGEGDFFSRIDRLVPNPVKAILAQRDTLGLTGEQVARLQSLSDSLDAKNAVLSDSVRAIVEKAGNGANPRELFARISPKLNEVRTNNSAALDEAKGVLTVEQWEKVPDSVKYPRGGTRPGRQGERREPPARE